MAYRTRSRSTRRSSGMRRGSSRGGYRSSSRRPTARRSVRRSSGRSGGTRTIRIVVDRSPVDTTAGLPELTGLKPGTSPKRPRF